jgi:hypothetical protein
MAGKCCPTCARPGRLEAPTCPKCGATFKQRYLRQKYCSTRCRNRVGRRSARKHYLQSRTCLECGVAFKPKKPGQRYRSRQCHSRSSSRTCENQVAAPPLAPRPLAPPPVSPRRGAIDRRWPCWMEQVRPWATGARPAGAAQGGLRADLHYLRGLAAKQLDDVITPPEQSCPRLGDNLVLLVDASDAGARPGDMSEDGLGHF